MPQNLTLRDSILRRPGMYFATNQANADALSPLLGSWALEALEAGASSVAIAYQGNERVELTRVGGTPMSLDSGVLDTAENIVIACSSAHQNEQLSDGARLIVQPDVRAFPMLALRGPHRLVGMLRDAATAFPSATVAFADELSGFQLRTRYPRGSDDRLCEEAGARSLRRVFRFVGANEHVRYDVAFSWCTGPGLQLIALTNGKRNANGGAHVLGVWEGVAAALTQRGVDCSPEQLPRTAAMVVSVHLESPRFGAATQDCLHDRRAREAVKDAVARDFFNQLGQEANGPTPPWQQLADIHARHGSWMTRAADELAQHSCLDPYAHHEEHGSI